MSTSRINQPPKSTVPGPKSESSTSSREVRKEDAAAGAAKAGQKPSAGAPRHGIPSRRSPGRGRLEAGTRRSRRRRARRVHGGGSAFEPTSGGAAMNVLGTRAAGVVGANALAVGAPVKRLVTRVYDGGPHAELTNLQLKGRWDATGRYSAQWNERTLPMKPLGEGKWAATVEVLDDGQPHDWEWGVLADGPTGKGVWAVMGEGNLKLDVKKATSTYAPTTYHEMGSRKSGTDARFKFWRGTRRACR